MGQIVVMPKIGLTAREALLTTWLVDIGQEVTEGDPLCEIETEKVTNEMESPTSGALLKRIEPEVVVPVGAPIAVIGTPGEDVSAVELFTPGEPVGEEWGIEAEEEGAAIAPGSEPAGRVKASPAARERAREVGLRLDQLEGTGPGGRITLEDVERASEGAPLTEGAADEAIREEPSRLRKAVAEAMSISATVPQFSLERDVDVTDARSRLRERSSESVGPSIVDLIGVATARAVRRHDEFLRSWVAGAFERRTRVNLGIAVAVQDGLIVPVVRDADRMTVEAFSEARRRLQERVGVGRLAASEASGAVFTLSNLGPFGVDRFRPLVNPPESGILAIGRIRDMGGREVMTLALSADHRVVDGAQGARLLADISQALEDPDALAELLGPSSSGS